jgi:uncharacterized membrane protein YphA (DoxX/SURF4 family)
VHQIIGVAAGAFLIAGLWTKVTASLAALDQIWIALSFLSLQRGNDITHALLASLCASVAMLGPGALSIDWQSYRRWISGRRIISNSQKE